MPGSSHVPKMEAGEPRGSYRGLRIEAGEKQELGSSCSLDPAGPRCLKQKSGGNCLLQKEHLRLTEPHSRHFLEVREAGERCVLRMGVDSRQKLRGSSSLEPDHLRQEPTGSCVLRMEVGGVGGSYDLRQVRGNFSSEPGGIFNLTKEISG